MRSNHPNRTSSKLTSFTAGAVCMLVLGGGSAVAATGGKFILGRANSETSTATLTNSRGVPLSLRAPAGRPALAVNTTTKVARLNADRLDGLSSEDIARVDRPTGVRTAVSDAFESEENSGEFDLLVAYADCPAGATVTGGGYSDFSSTGVVVDSSPGDDGSYWQVVAVVDPTAGEPADGVQGWAVCYDPLHPVAAQTLARTSSAEADAVLTKDLLRVARARAMTR